MTAGTHSIGNILNLFLNTSASIVKKTFKCKYNPLSIGNMFCCMEYVSVILIAVGRDSNPGLPGGRQASLCRTLYFATPHPCNSVGDRGSQRDVVYLGWPIASSLMSPNAGGWGGFGGVGGHSQWVQLCTRSPNKLWRSNSIINLWSATNARQRFTLIFSLL